MVKVCLLLNSLVPSWTSWGPGTMENGTEEELGFIIYINTQKVLVKHSRIRIGDAMWEQEESVGEFEEVQEKKAT